MTKDTIWQRIGDDSVPATGALLFACLLAAITVWFSAGATGPWLAVLGLGLALVTLAFDSIKARSLLMPIFLGISGVGLALFSGGFGSAAACAVLWPVLGAIAVGGRFINGVIASACAFLGLVVAGLLLPISMPDAMTQQSGILALGVSGALLLAACLRIKADRSRVVEARNATAQLRAATISRDEALAQAKVAKEQTHGRAQFMAEMSHEIRTPLNAILGFADTMREGVFGPLPQAYGDYPDLIHTSGTHLLDLVSDLLDLSKIEAGRYETNLKALRLDDVAYEGVRLSSGAARAAGVQIRHEASAPIEIEGDARALRQIVFNLISNAIKFTPSGGRVTLRVIADPETQQASLEVEDTGVGIGATDLAKIGEPWNQSAQTAEGTAKTSRGSGLGLALVKRLTDLQSGKFAINSELGVGTRARVTFPLAKPPAA